MTTSILRTADAWWVQTATGAVRIATTATATGELLADRAAIDTAAAAYRGPEGLTLPLAAVVARGRRAA